MKIVLIPLLTLLISLPAAAGVRGTIEQLTWMTGAWSGDVGEGRVLEENWIRVDGGSIASLVRITQGDTTPMVELIVIEQQGDSLMLYVKQWDPGFTPRSEKPQVMELVAIEERLVSFQNKGEGNFRTLTYSSPTPETFVISIMLANGQPVEIPLQSRSFKGEALPVLAVDDPWIREAPPVAPVHAGYMTLLNEGSSAVTLVGVSSPDYARGEIHDMSMEGGMMRMRQLQSVTLAPGESLLLEPGGKHLMLHKAKRPLRAGDEVELVLNFSDGRSQPLTATVYKGK